MSYGQSSVSLLMQLKTIILYTRFLHKHNILPIVPTEELNIPNIDPELGQTAPVQPTPAVVQQKNS